LFEKPPRVIKVFPRFAEEGLRDMLLLLILIAWLTLIVFVVNLCRGASAGEAPPATSRRARPLSISGLTVWEYPQVSTHGAARLLRAGQPAGRRESSCDARAHRPHHLAGS